MFNGEIHYKRPLYIAILTLPEGRLDLQVTPATPVTPPAAEDLPAGPVGAA